VKVSDIS